MPGHVLGHEPAGRVLAVGEEVTTFTEGDHVAVPFNLGDGTCRLCKTGHSNICENRLALGLQPEAPGAFAEQVPVPNADHNLVALPEGVSSTEMAGLGCRFMTAFHALGMPPERYDEIFRMVGTGKLDPAAVITDRIALKNVSATLDAMTEFETVGIPVVREF